jgi:hypothetical protein
VGAGVDASVGVGVLTRTSTASSSSKQIEPDLEDLPLLQDFSLFDDLPLLDDLFDFVEPDEDELLGRRTLCLVMEFSSSCSFPFELVKRRGKWFWSSVSPWLRKCVDVAP